ncbi:MAG: hypothetical protein ACI8RZ_007617 [Myxococcota bacterium]|jgi:hypothetical protein
MILTLLLACNQDSGPLLPASPPTAPDTPTQTPKSTARTLELLDRADAVAAADLDGDGFDELILIEDGEILLDDVVLGTLRGNIQHVSRGDIDGDGDEEALIAAGAGRADRDAPAQLWAVHGDRAELIWEQDGERAQVADLHVVDGRIFLAAFSDDRTVQGGWLTEGSIEVIGEANLGLAQLPMPDGSLLIGRIYGDEPRSDGDLKRHKGARVSPLPTLRGVKSLEIADLDSDGVPEVLVSDGWHYQYGHTATARVRLHTGDFLTARTLATFDESYTVRHMEVFGEGAQQSILVTASKAVHLMTRDELGWKTVKLDKVSETANAVVLKEADGWWAAVAGRATTKVPIEL